MQIKAVVIDDLFYLNYTKAQNIVDTCKDTGIKVNLFPHTCFINDMKEDYFNIKKNIEKYNYYPNIITNSEYRKENTFKLELKKKFLFVDQEDFSRMD